ncbi:tetratricopeptide repeat protein [Pseudoduganella sp. DS3]|uniref:Tetratricopeptide repeat protein n=1 Tax=Pseudoduganella guangdongensis TaxID=2692179 RepID=A0A6N9HMA7_9BURK|nr:tetratricopeptide repeat protein [Pseudoduganella guangdongensis]MYN03815.1 tetratricopeptide repeat protein [Pseudoduganella guangdongensis]
MSLINKMLQDLDARGGAPQAAGMPDAVRAVPDTPPYRRSVLLIGLAVVILLAGAASAGWRYWNKVPAADVVPVAPAKGVIKAAPAADAPQLTPPEQMVDGLPLPAPLAPQPGTAKVQPLEKAAPERRGHVAKARQAAPERSPKMTATKEASGGGTSQLTSVARDGGVQVSATTLYERAQSKLLSARIQEAISDLEAALEIDQRHLAARETLVAVLVENQRHSDAMRHLRRALVLTPQQTGMAMLLARLQLEHGGGSIDTLQRSLPYAETNADYRAMFANVLERDGRHREAADHYQAAVRLQPGNAVWWMGMGISLQADQRNAEAKVAFQRARDIGRLTPELQSFVERRLQQLN